MFEELERALRSLLSEEGLVNVSIEQLNPSLPGFLPPSGYIISIEEDECMFVNLRDNTRGRELLNKIEASIKSYNLCYTMEYGGDLTGFKIYALRSNQHCSGEKTYNNYSDNEVLVDAMNDITCKMDILKTCSSYPRYDISLYQIVYGLCNAKKIGIAKWEVTFNGHVLEPDIYATGYNERHTFSKKYTFELLCGTLRFVQTML